MCCLRDVILKIERDLSNNIWNTSISGDKFSWTTLYMHSTLSSSNERRKCNGTATIGAWWGRGSVTCTRGRGTYTFSAHFSRKRTLFSPQKLLYIYCIISLLITILKWCSILAIWFVTINQWQSHFCLASGLNDGQWWRSAVDFRSANCSLTQISLRRYYSLDSEIWVIGLVSCVFVNWLCPLMQVTLAQPTKKNHQTCHQPLQAYYSLTHCNCISPVSTPFAFSRSRLTGEVWLIHPPLGLSLLPCPCNWDHQRRFECAVGLECNESS